MKQSDIPHFWLSCTHEQFLQCPSQLLGAAGVNEPQPRLKAGGAAGADVGHLGSRNEPSQSWDSLPERWFRHRTAVKTRSAAYHKAVLADVQLQGSCAGQEAAAAAAPGQDGAPRAVSAELMGMAAARALLETRNQSRG